MTFLSRRRLLAAGLGGAAYATLGGLPISAWAATVDPKLAGKILNLVIRYRTDPERIARILPPGIEPDEAADVMLDWWVRYPTPGSENLFYPDVYSECGVHVTAKHQGRRGMFQVDMPLDQEWGRTAGRETVGLLKKDGELRLTRDGQTITADLHRRGKLLYRVRTRVVDKPAHPLFWHRETGFGAFLYRYRLNPNWKEGPLSSDPVELWLRVLAGKEGKFPEQMVVGGPRECDMANTKFEFVEPSVLDPISEFPVRQFVGISYSETGYAPADEAAYRGKAPRTPTRVERLQFIDNRAFEPWALMNYDRPITAGKAWMPVNWPAKTTALKLSASELKQYRERATLNAELKEFVDLQLEIDPATHARTLPAPLKAGTRPIVRILAAQVGPSDLTTQPFTELWLLSRCEFNGAEAWYALSNIVGTGGDVTYGRETFGYPSKTGKVDWRAGSEGRVIMGERMERSFARLSLPGTQAAAGAGVQRSTLIGLRMLPPYRVMTLTGFSEPGPRGELVAQPWSLETTAQSALPLDQCKFDFPTKVGPGKIGLNDPWFEFAGAKIVSATVGKGVTRRSPGQIVSTVEGFKPFYLERFDGTDDSNQATAGGLKPTFLAGA